MSTQFRQIQDAYKYLKNPQRFSGNRPITLRSSWEIDFVFKFLDTNSNIIEWKSEDIYIPYRFAGDNKIHKYFPDFYVKVKNKEGKITEKIIEIKPQKDLKINRNKKNIETVVKNTNKFEAVQEYCKQKGMEFLILTERELYGKS